jgi:hypothetical protein
MSGAMTAQKGFVEPFPFSTPDMEPFPFSEHRRKSVTLSRCSEGSVQRVLRENFPRSVASKSSGARQILARQPGMSYRSRRSTAAGLSIPTRSSASLAMRAERTEIAAAIEALVAQDSLNIRLTRTVVKRRRPINPLTDRRTMTAKSG